MANKFCRYLTNQKRFSYGSLKPCSWITKSADLSDSNEVAEYQKWLHGINDWVPECSFCLKAEQNNTYSPRLEAFRRFAEFDTDETVSIEIQIDRDCNGACLICDINNSTTWWKYNPDANILNIDYYLENELDVKKYVKQIEKHVDFGQVKKILFNGGEPLRSDAHTEIIDKIVQAQSPDKVTLHYVTNGSIMPDSNLIETWKKFRRVSLRLSIDGINEHFNYLRWPLHWDQVESNIKKLLDLKIPTLKIGCSYTVTPFSIFYHNQYVNWAKGIFNGTDISAESFFSEPAGANGIMNLSSVPNELREELFSKYSTKVQTGHSVIKCLKPYNPNSYQIFMDYITKQDQIRGTNWREVFPEMVQYFSLDNSS